MAPGMTLPNLPTLVIKTPSEATMYTGGAVHLAPTEDVFVLGSHAGTTGKLSMESVVDEVMGRMYGEKCGRVVIPCQYCGQWGARMHVCRHCGGPIE